MSDMQAASCRIPSSAEWHSHGWGAQAAPAHPHSGESEALGKGESNRPPTMHETWGTPQELPLLQKAATFNFLAQANVDSRGRPWLAALSDSRGGAKTFGAFCKLGMEQIFPPV